MSLPMLRSVFTTANQLIADQCAICPSSDGFVSVRGLMAAGDGRAAVACSMAGEG